MLETIAIAAGVHIFMEKLIDSTELTRNFCRGNTMIQAGEMSINALQEEIVNAIVEGQSKVKRPDTQPAIAQDPRRV